VRLGGSRAKEVAVVDVAMLTVAEHLAVEFPAEPETTVIGIVTECAEEHGDSDPAFVEQAARARLAARRERPDEVDVAPGDDVLDVSLEDTELLSEVALLTDVIIAAGQSEVPLDQQQIDGILGLPT
jgi:hypothetical protein